MATRSQLKEVAAIPSAALDDWGPVPVPIGEPVSRLRGRTLCSNADGGEPFHIRAGDVVWYSANSRGVWQVLETVRKTFLTYKSA